MSFLQGHRRSLSIILMLAFVGWGAIYLYQHPENLTRLAGVSAYSLALLVGLGLLKLAAMGMFTWASLGAFGARLSFWEWYGLSAVTAMGNYVIPFRGGAAFRGIYLKSKYGFPYSLFLSTVAALYVVTFLTNSFLGLLALLILDWKLGISQPALVLLLTACIVVPVILLALSRRAPHISWLGGSRLRSIMEGGKMLMAKPSTVAKLILASALNSLVTVLMIHFSFHALGVELPLIKSSVLGILYLISAMIPVTPAGMGFAEAALVMVSSTFGLDNSVNILAAGLNRSIMMMASLLLGPGFSLLLSRHRTEPISAISPHAMTSEGDRRGEGP